MDFSRWRLKDEYDRGNREALDSKKVAIGVDESGGLSTFNQVLPFSVLTP